MPVDPGTTTPIFNGMLVANGLIGPGTTKLAAGLAAGLFQYVSTAITVSSIDVGTLGVGVGNGIGVILLPSVILGALSPMMAGNGVLGAMAPSMANAIANGLSACLALAAMSTNNPGVGIGAGKLQLFPTGAGGVTFVAAFKEAGLGGVMVSALGQAVGTALDAVIVSALGVIAIVGPASPLPGAGVGVGKIS